MTGDQVRQLIEFRLKQANETLQEGEILANEKLWHGATNRAYYAMFYAVLALAVDRDQAISKHAGVIAFFDREFVRSGIFPKEYSKVLHLAFERRQTIDYGEFSFAEEGDAQQILAEARIFVDSIAAYLNTKSN